MEKFQKCLMLMLVAALSLTFTSCSDDDEPKADSLSGTSWQILSDNGIEGAVGTVITFNKDGSLSYPITWEGWDWSYAKWSISNKKLKIIFMKDEIFEGTFVINGNYATYTYYWYDYDGEWFDEESYVMTLQKV